MESFWQATLKEKMSGAEQQRFIK